MTFPTMLGRTALLLGPWLAIVCGCEPSISDSAAAGNGGTGSGGQPGSCVHSSEEAPATFDAYKSGAATAPACGGQTWDPLPCGGCSDNAVCTVSHARECCGVAPSAGAPSSPIDAWLCSCEDGAWQCWVLFPAASACFCAADAGTD
ncbi:Hypothetical protein A7982_04818 [Minicystis rosea]|nr:Hypothetical protein A7982_04818 [Minicystis rosea]